MDATAHRAGLRRLPLRAAAFVVLTCTAILGISAWREWSAREAMLDDARTDATNLARSLTQHAEDSLELLDSSVIGVVSRLETDGSDPATIEKVLAILKSRKDAIERIYSLDIIGADGKWLTSPGEVADTLSDDQFFRHHQMSESREPFVGGPVRSYVDGQWLVPLSRRFNRRDGGFGGVVVATMRSAYLSQFYQQFEIGRHGAISLAHAAGIVLARTPDAEKYLGRDLSDRPIFRDSGVRQRQSGIYTFNSAVDGKERLSAFRRSSRFPIVTFVTVQKAELLAPWRAAASVRMSFVIALVALIAILGAVLVRQLLRGQRMAAALAEKEAHFRLLAEGSSDMVTRIGLDERIRYVSPSCIRVVGWRSNQLIGTPALAGVNPEDLPQVRRIVAAIKQGEREEARITYRNVHREKSEVWLESSMRVTRRSNGQVDGVVSITRDITEQKRLESRLETLAIEDSLTGLANRRCFDERLAQEWARAYRDRSSLGLLMIDVDHFKAYNDEYGHPAGDACLRAVAEAIAKETHRAGDLAARYGGEEFAILLPSTDAAGCARIGDRIRQVIRDSNLVHTSNPVAGRVTVSVGGAVCRPGLERSAGPASLVEAADRALYAAKEAGRDRLTMSSELASLLPLASGQ